MEADSTKFEHCRYVKFNGAPDGGGTDPVSREKIEAYPASRRIFWLYPASRSMLTLLHFCIEGHPKIT